MVSAERKLDNLKKMIESSTMKTGIAVDSDLHEDLSQIMEENTQGRMRVKNIGGAEYHVAVRSRQGGGCRKGNVFPPTQSTKKILLV